ncbi:MAG: hypothetical protein QW579_06820 [Desulfurococcaceae archaeon]
MISDVHRNPEDEERCKKFIDIYARNVEPVLTLNLFSCETLVM